MAWSFGDSFDLYAAAADGANGYWDSVAGSPPLVAGRFVGSQALQLSNTPHILIKTSGVNDAVHHLVVGFRQTAVITGSSLGLYFQLLDNVTGQCAVVFRSDGAILLTSGTAAGTVLATYTGAFPVINTWYAFEFEIVINNTTGRFRVRKNGNNVDDFDSGAVLNTRPTSTNNYANKLTVSQQVTVNATQIDDLFWRSDASSVAWMGDIRCYTRMPASDASVQFARAPISTQQSISQNTTVAIAAGTARYTSALIAPFDGTIGTVVASLSAGYTGNMKCSIFAAGTTIGALLGSATPITNPATGNNAFTFPTPPAVTKGQTYYVGFDSDTASGTWNGFGSGGFTSVTAYASFPVSNPPTSTGTAAPTCTVTVTASSNATLVSEAQQDGTTSYVYDSTPGHADFYGIGSIASTPVATIAVVTRGYMEKSDAGTRTAAVQLKSGGATVAAPTLTLTTSGWQWVWRMDLTDPNTGSAWTPAAVNNATIGPVVVA